MARIRCLLNEAATISGQQLALLDRSRSLHFLELEQQVRRLAMLLTNAGLRPGMRVALRLQNGIDLISLLLAIPRTGALPAPLNTRLPAATIAAQVRAMDAEFLITSRADNPGLDLPGVRVLEVERLDAFVEGHADPLEEPHYDLEAPHLLVFTSGSTGEPKAAVLSYGALYYSARGVNPAVDLRSNDKWLLSLPLFHVGGLGVLYRCLLAGATMVLPAPGEDLGEELLLYNATHASLVPTQLARLLGHGELGDLARQMKAVMVGGAALSDALLEEAVARRLPVLAGYGLTEMASTVTLVPRHAPPAVRRTAGALLRHREMRIDEQGQILLRGPTLFLGYWRDGAPVSACAADGWFRTGDLGECDAAGHLRILGRADNMFISGGENIHPEAVERAICLHTGALEALVVPMPHPEFGHRPVAFVRMPDATAPLDGLREKLLPHLAKYQIPDAFHPLPLERGEGVKINRAQFARLAAGMARR